MEANSPEYYIVVERPVKFVPTEDGGMSILKYNFETGRFDYGMEYLSRVMFSKDDDIEQVSEDEFVQQVEKLRGRKLQGEGTVYDLYELINAMEDNAQQTKQELTNEDKALIAILRRKTYELFEQNESL